MMERDEDMGDGDRAELGPEALEGRLLCTELGRGRGGFRAGVGLWLQLS